MRVTVFYDVKNLKVKQHHLAKLEALVLSRANIWVCKKSPFRISKNSKTNVSAVQRIRVKNFVKKLHVAFSAVP
jgi:hypothetical protein